MILTILTDDNPILQTPCEPITEVTEDIRALAANMLETMYDAKGIGLAAPQVGVSKRILVMDCSPDKNQPIVLINPEITVSKGSISFTEGCLSFPGVQYNTKRASYIRLRFEGLDGEGSQATLTGLWAVCFQHELDHLDGITFEKRGQKVQSAVG